MSDPVPPSGPVPDPTPWAPPAEPARPEPTRPGPVLAALVLVALVVAGLGVPLGLLWSAVAPDVPLVLTERGPAYAVPQPEELVAADGWFAVLAVPFGVLTAAGVWLAGRRWRRGVAPLAALTVGAVAAGLLAWWLGRQVGLTGYQETLAAAEVGTDLTRPSDLTVAEAGWWPPHVFGVVLVPALAAVATYTLLAAWSRFPGLRPESPPAGGHQWPPGAGCP